MKVLLVDPPGIEGIPVGRVLGSFGTNKADQAWPPYDLQILAGALKARGHEPRILDANNLGLSFARIGEEIRAWDPQWVLHLTCFQTFELDAGVARAAKEADPGIRTACLSLSMRSVEDPAGKLAAHPELDFLPWGEPELPLLALVGGAAPETVPGILFRDGGGAVCDTGPAVRVADLDELGEPVHEGLPLERYRCPLARRRPLTIVNCSRGCINWCVHCQAGAFQKPLRYRSVAGVLGELRTVRRLGVREIKFYDCSLPTKREFAAELCEAMRAERLGFTWHCNARADRLDAAILALMRRAGCHTVSIGCESASPAILKGMRKNETVEQIERGVRLVQEAGMRVLMYLTFGLEGECRETMEETFAFARRLRPDYVTFGIVVPAPGTPFFRKLEERGQLARPEELHRQDPTALPSFRYPDLPAEEVLAFTREAYRRYYLSPGYVVRRAASLRSLAELEASVSNAASVIRRYVLRAK